MKILLHISTACLALLAGAAALATPIFLLGTGVQMEVPAYLSQTKAGSTLTDESGETIIAFSGGISKANLETDPTWRALYPDAPEKIATGHIKGNLYKRTRAHDGGKWDGWFLAIPRGKKSLVVMVSYTGNSPAAFARLRDYLLTIRWDDANAQPEQAMGIRLAPKGMRIEPGTFGGLAYRETGRDGGADPDIIAYLMPLPASQTAEFFPAICNATIGTGFAAQQHEGPVLRERDGTRFCEGWSTAGSGATRYIALVRLPSGALLTMMGSSPTDQLTGFSNTREAVYNLELLR